MTPSIYQEAILSAFETTGDNLIIQACAGSGKTTTLNLVCQRIPVGIQAVALAFNKVNADAFKDKLPAHIMSSTMHSLGWSMIRRVIPSASVDKGKQRRLLCELLDRPGSKTIDPALEELAADIRDVAALSMATLTDTTNPDAVGAMLDAYGAQPASDTPFQDIVKLVDTFIAMQRADRANISFDDMIDHVVFHKLRPEVRPDVILGDEVQDWNEAQAAFIRRLAEPAPQALAAPGAGLLRGRAVAPAQKPSRVLLVGDRRQAIYAFRGASHTSMDNLKVAFNCRELPLSVCYRCPVSVISLAQTAVGPDEILSAEGAPNGEVRYHVGNALPVLLGLEPGSMVMCRRNRPLAPLALAMLREGRGVKLRGGPDYVAHLTAPFKMLPKNWRMGVFSGFKAVIEKTLTDKVNAKAEKMVKAGNATGADALHDYFECLMAFMKYDEIPDDANVVQATRQLIERLIDGAGVIFSSIHRAKGLEAHTCVLLRPDLLPNAEERANKVGGQELNLFYVAVTRAMDTLIVVEDPDDCR